MLENYKQLLDPFAHYTNLENAEDTMTVSIVVPVLMELGQPRALLRGLGTSQGVRRYRGRGTKTGRGIASVSRGETRDRGAARGRRAVRIREVSPRSKKCKDTKTKIWCPKCKVHLCMGRCFELYDTRLYYRNY